MSFFLILLSLMHFHPSPRGSEESSSFSILLQGKWREQYTEIHLWVQFGSCGLAAFCFVLCFPAHSLKLKRKSLQEMDQRVFTTNSFVKKQKRRKEMTPNPTLGRKMVESFRAERESKGSGGAVTSKRTKSLDQKDLGELGTRWVLAWQCGQSS